MTVNLTALTGEVMNTSGTLKIVVLINGMSMTTTSTGIYNLTIIPTIANSNNYTIMLATSNVTTISALRFSRFILDQTAVQATQTTFIDAGVLTAYNNAWVGVKLKTILPYMNISNFLVGVTTMVYNSTAAANFFYDASVLACSGGLTFYTLAFGYWSYRFRTCASPFVYYSSVTDLCYDSCPSYYYAVTVGLYCAPCYYSCFTCSSATTSTTCTSCSPLDFRTLTSATCLCNAGYFDNGVAPCVACSYSCATCANSTSCLTCSATSFRTLTSGQCPCNSGYYDNGTSICKTCSSLVANCAVCTTTPTAACMSCLTGFYPSGTSSCLACSQYCKTCTSSTACTTCSTTFVVVSGVCTCMAGFVVNPTNLTCVTCSSMILGCVSCASSTVCMSCNTASRFQLSGATCTCQTGYYLSGSSCVSCPTGCTACTSATVCTSCDAPSHYVQSSTSCVCDAANGYTLSGGSCQLCSSLLSGCLTCSSSSNCTQCMTGLSQPVSLLSSGLCSCPVGYTFSATTPVDCVLCPTCCLVGSYYDAGTSSCQAYSVVYANCAACTSSACTSCNSGNYLSSGTCFLCSTALPGCLSCND